jgi:hypothetical protein
MHCLSSMLDGSLETMEITGVVSCPGLAFWCCLLYLCVGGPGRFLLLSVPRIQGRELHHWRTVSDNFSIRSECGITTSHVDFPSLHQQPLRPIPGYIRFNVDYTVPLDVVDPATRSDAVNKISTKCLLVASLRFTCYLSHFIKIILSNAYLKGDLPCPRRCLHRDPGDHRRPAHYVPYGQMACREQVN